MITFTEDQIKIIKDNFERKGAAHQRDKLVEELSELLCEVCKHRVKQNRETQMIDEFADVLVVLKGFDVEVPHTSNTLAGDTGIIELLTIYLGNVNKGRDLRTHRLKHIFNYVCIWDNFEYLQNTVNHKIERMSAKKQSYRVEPYEIIK